eukprot:SAG11_NODE_1838_length_4187_cov_3.622554_4_plen_76_part_00
MQCLQGDVVPAGLTPCATSAGAADTLWPCAALAGTKATCFAYGQTGAGKTFTMMGPQNDDGAAMSLVGESAWTTG